MILVSNQTGISMHQDMPCMSSVAKVIRVQRFIGRESKTIMGA
jgi:hypothetical protein